MSNDATRISLTQIRQVLEILGIEPDTRKLRTIFIEPGRVTVVRKRSDENGRDIVIESHNEVATETITIPVFVSPGELQTAVDARAYGDAR